MNDRHTGGRRDAVHVVAQRWADQRQHPVGYGHHPSLRAADDMAPSLRRLLWMKPQLWITAAAKTAFRNHWRTRRLSGLREGQK